MVQQSSHTHTHTHTKSRSWSSLDEQLGKSDGVLDVGIHHSGRDTRSYRAEWITWVCSFGGIPRFNIWHIVRDTKGHWHAGKKGGKHSQV